METEEQEKHSPITVAGIDIPVADQTPLVLALLSIIQRQQVEIQELRDEIQRLKKTTVRPKIKPSRLLNPPVAENRADGQKKRPGSAKRKKTKDLRIDQDMVIVPDDLPPGALLEGYRDFVVQDIEFKSVNTRYRRAVYRLDDNSLLVGKRPDGVSSHFGPTLIEYILLQTHQNHVTQGRLLEQLRELGVDISAGQLSNILLKGHENFHAEKDELLPTARQISGTLHCDDTSARHRGQAAVCTHIGNELWEEQLTAWGIVKDAHRRSLSEAGLFGTLLTEKWYTDLGLVSDDAPQFKLLGFVHGLCWVHGERKIDRLIPLTPQHRKAKEQAQDCFWEIYKRLTAFRQQPSEAAKESIADDFAKLCLSKTSYPDLNEALLRLHAKRDEFLTVLEYPHLPLHNNLSENDIREYARLRKISGGTRSDLGRRCRDTFMSLKKTCRKLGLSFQEYLRDRICGIGTIPLLSDVMRQAAVSSANAPPAIVSD